MVDNDIISRPDAYKEIKKRDINIDFRRVRESADLFEEFGVSLTHETEQIESGSQEIL